MQARVDGADQPIQVLLHPRYRVFELSRRGTFRWKRKMGPARKADPGTPAPIPLLQVVAELRPKLVERSHHFPVDVLAGLRRLLDEL